jgi:isopentenyldiphosphate isomerase
VSPRGKTVGTAPRSACHGNPELAHRAVHILVCNSKGELLLQKRSSSKRIQPGKWDSSVGGHLMPGEAYEEAACREAGEELGIDLTNGKIHLNKLHDYIWQTKVETEHIRTFECVSDGPFQFNAKEISDLRFWSVSELREAKGTGLLTPNLEEELTRLNLF